MNNIINRAYVDNQPLEIIYLSDSNQMSQRTILIKEIGLKSIKAYCFTKKQIRTFKIENILSAGRESRKRYGRAI